MSHFNFFGNPAPEGDICETGKEIDAYAETLFDRMVEEGASVVEIRAAASYLIGGINCSMSMVIMQKQCNMRKSPVNAGASVNKSKSTTRRRVVTKKKVKE